MLIMRYILGKRPCFVKHVPILFWQAQKITESTGLAQVEHVFFLGAMKFMGQHLSTSPAERNV